MIPKGVEDQQVARMDAVPKDPRVLGDVGYG
jgi:hypothetical protein